jgi:hypothetical protein
VLFDGLMTQSEINSLLDEIFGRRVRDLRFTRRESGRIPTIPCCSLLKADFSPPYGRSVTGVLVNPGACYVSKRIACA